MAAIHDRENPEIGSAASASPAAAPRNDPGDLPGDPAPETVNLSQEDEGEQAQSLADAVLRSDGSDAALPDSTKVTSGDSEDDVQDLVDHMNDMVASGRIDMGAYRGERNDDDEEGSLGSATARE